MDGTLVEQRTYNAADQVVGWSYDALGRLTSTTHGGTMTTHAYNGNDVLIAQSSGNTTTRSTQDLVAPLSQILQLTQGTSRTDYVYGRERLMALEGTAQTWYGSDARGSVRQTLDATGAPLSALHYDPWGTPQGGATPPVFGFTGELQDATSGLVYLRARWYQPQHGRFLSRDPWQGFPTQPYSQHPYQYAYGDPVLHIDPSGQCPPSPQGEPQPCPGPSPQHFDPKTFATQFLPQILPLVQRSARTYGVPWQVLAGLIHTEIAEDTNLNDHISDIVYKNAPLAGIAVTWLLKKGQDPGVGAGNVHISTARDTARYFAEQYKDCLQLQLDIPYSHGWDIEWIQTNTYPYPVIIGVPVPPSIANVRRDRGVTQQLAELEFNIQVVAAITRRLADFRFGQNERPDKRSHAAISQWTLADVVALWHGYRYGVPGVSPKAEGFKQLAHFQDRNLRVQPFVNRYVLGPGNPKESAMLAKPYFLNYYPFPDVRGR